MSNDFFLPNKDSFDVKIQKLPTKDKQHSISTKITTKKIYRRVKYSNSKNQDL